MIGVIISLILKSLVIIDKCSLNSDNDRAQFDIYSMW
jgi:hypothetical protein